MIPERDGYQALLQGLDDALASLSTALEIAQGIEKTLGFRALPEARISRYRSASLTTHGIGTAIKSLGDVLDTSAELCTLRAENRSVSRNGGEREADPHDGHRPRFSLLDAAAGYSCGGDVSPGPDPVSLPNCRGCHEAPSVSASRLEASAP